MSCSQFHRLQAKCHSVDEYLVSLRTSLNSCSSSSYFLQYFGNSIYSSPSDSDVNVYDAYSIAVLKKGRIV